MGRRQELVIFAVGAVLLTLAAYLLAIHPKAGDIGKANLRKQQAEAKAQQLQNDIRALNDIRKNAVPLQTRARAVKSLYPTTPDLPDLVNGLQRIADQSGVDLTSITPAPPMSWAPNPALAQIATGLTVTGGYFQIEDFLSRLENMVRSPDPALKIPPRSLLVKTINIGTSTSSAGGSGSASSGATATTIAGSNGDVLTATVNLVAFESVGTPVPPSASAGTGAAPATGTGSSSTVQKG